MIDNTKGLQLARDVYANPTEAMYQKYKDSPYFSRRFMNEAMQRGESDTYFALLSSLGKDAKLDARFTNDDYYDYERMMTELYKEASADDTKKIERFDNVYNPQNDAYEPTSLGLMSEKEYLDYEIGKAYALKQDAIKRETDRLHKEQMSGIAKFGATVGATLAEIGEGAIAAGAGLVDALAVPFAATQNSLSDWSNWFENIIDYYANDSLTALEKQSLRAAMDEWERTDTFMRDIDGNYTTVGKYLGSTANSIGAMIPSMLIGAIPVVGQTVGPASFYGYIISNYLFDNATNPKLKDSPAWLKVGNAALNATLEWALEEGLAKILGPSPEDIMIGVGRRAGVGRTLADLTSNMTGAKYLVGGALKEGLEEFLQDFGTGLNNYVLDEILKGNGKAYGYSDEDFSIQTLIDSFVMGALTSLVMTSASAGFRQIVSPTYINTENGVQKLSMLNNAYFRDYISTLNEAIADMQNDPRKAMQNGNARAIYDMINSIASYTEAIGEERMRAANKLLTSYVEASKAQAEIELDRAKTILTKETYKEAIADRAGEYETLSGNVFAAAMMSDLNEFFKSQDEYKKAYKAQKKNAKDAKRIERELKKGNVTRVESAVHNGEEVATRTEQTAQTAQTGQTTQTDNKENAERAAKLKRLSKGYEWVFTTDGHIAVDADNILYVSEAWLDNYTVDEINEFLVQSKLIDTLDNIQELKELVKEIVEFDKEFTKQTDVDTSRALLDFLFNPTVSQKFILSNDGANAKKFGKFIARMDTIVKNAASVYPLDKAKQNMLKSMVQKAKETMRIPCMKAVLTWGIDEGIIMGSSIFTDADKQFILQYRANKTAMMEGNETVIGNMIDTYSARRQEMNKHLTPEQIRRNDEYFEAIKNNDEETMRRLVTEAAKEAGMLTRPDSDEPWIMYKGDNVDYDTLNYDEKMFSYFMSPDITVSSTYAYLSPDDTNVLRTNNESRNTIRETQSKVRPFYVKTDYDKLYHLKYKNGTIWSHLPVSEEDKRDIIAMLNDMIASGSHTDLEGSFTKMLEQLNNEGTTNTRTLSALAKSKGYTGIIYENISDYAHNYDEAFLIDDRDRNVVTAFFKPTKIYSADLITYDDAGNIIPLSDRFEGDDFRGKFDELSKSDIEDDKISLAIMLSLAENDLGLSRFAEIQSAAFIGDAADTAYVNDVLNKARKVFNIPADVTIDEYITGKYDYSKVEAQMYIDNYTGEIVDTVDVDARATEVIDWLDKELGPDYLVLNFRSHEDFYKLSSLRIVKVAGDLKTSIYKLYQQFKENHNMLSIPYGGDYVDDADKREDVAQRQFPLHTRKSDGYATLYLTPHPDGYTEYAKIPVGTVALHSLTQDELAKMIAGIVSRYAGIYDTTILNLRLNKSREFKYQRDAIDNTLRHFPDLIDYLCTHTDKDVSNLRTALKKYKNGEVLLNIEGFTYSPANRGPHIDTRTARLQNDKYSQTFNIDEMTLLVYATHLVTKYQDILHKEHNPTDVGGEVLQKGDEYYCCQITDNLSMRIDPDTLNSIYAKQFAHVWNRVAGDKGRNTVHTKLSANAQEAVGSLIRPGLNPDMYYVDEIVKDPLNLANADIVARLDGNADNAYAVIRQYVEETIPGMSLDIIAHRDGKQTYVLVDDEAFTDLYTDDLLNKDPNAELDYDGKTVPLSRFIRLGSLVRLGLNNVTVEFDPDADHSTARVTKEYPSGHIIVGTKGGLDYATFSETLNHEFRHLLQARNKFAYGFNLDFDVTNAMVADIKKNVPDLFNEQMRKIVKHQFGNDINTDKEIARLFIYMMTAGEINAYAPNAIVSKPAVVIRGDGVAKIMMPWYNGTSGVYEAQLNTAKATETVEEKAKTEQPKTAKTTKTAKVEKARSNYIFPKAAEGNNLRYFVERANKFGVQPKLDPRLQDFVIATTGKEEILPPEILHAIEKGVLNYQNFGSWFKRTNLSDMSQDLFDVINNTVFKNEHIKTPQELNNLVEGHVPAQLWAAARVLRRKGVSYDSLLAENDVNRLLAILNGIEAKDAELRDAINEKAKDFDVIRIEHSDGRTTKEQRAPSEVVKQNARITMMTYFDGSLVGAFYAAEKFRRLNELNENAIGRTVKSTNTAIGDDEDGDTHEQSLTEEDRLQENDTVGTDLLAYYKKETGGTRDQMVHDLMEKMYDQKVRRAVAKRFDPSKADDPQKATNIKKRRTMARNILSDPKKLQSLDTLIDNAVNEGKTATAKFLSAVRELAMDISADMAVYNDNLSQLSDSDIRILLYGNIVDEMTGNDTQLSDKPEKRNERASIAAAIKNRGRTIAGYLNDELLTIDELPAEVAAMFEKVKGKWTIKADVYSVGRGAVARGGEPESTFGNLNYTGKKELGEDPSKNWHPTDKIAANLTTLQDNMDAIKEAARARKALKKEAARKKEKDVTNAAAKVKKSNAEQSKTQITGKTDTELKNTQIDVKVERKGKGISDTPDSFTIVSPKEMPPVLRDLFAVSFGRFADTKVQSVSVDADGNVLTGENYDDFKSTTQHEVSNYKLFYDFNAFRLSKLTRADALAIIDFLDANIVTFDGPDNKLQAFKIFTLAYLYSVDKTDPTRWNFTPGEREKLRHVLEAKSSSGGSILNAVSQIQEVIDPNKRVRKEVMKQNGMTEDEADELIKCVEKMQNAKTPEEARAAANEANEKIRELINARIENEVKPKPWTREWFNKIWDKIKNLRSVFMLSNPATGIRNLISNISLKGLNKLADTIAKGIFSEKMYRADQYDLTHVNASAESKDFIKLYIENNPMFDILYNQQNKYDRRYDTKTGTARKDLFVRILTKAVANKYGMQVRFDTKIGQTLSNIVTWMISDEKFVRSAVNDYFAKMLTLEVQSGRMSYDEGMSDRVLNLFTEAVIAANDEYMHKRSFFADALDGMRDRHPVAYEALTFWQPFLNSQFNWFTEIMKFTPMGLVSSIVKLSRLERRIEKAQDLRNAGYTNISPKMTEFLARRDIGKGIIGLLFSGLGALLAAFGLIRIEDDDDKAYVHVGDVKFDISDIFGTSSILVGAVITQGIIDKNMSFDETIGAATEELLDGFVLNDFISRHKYDSSPWYGLLYETESMLSSFVPQFWQLVVRFTNSKKVSYSRNTQGIIDRWFNSFAPTQPAGNRVYDPYTGKEVSRYAIPVVGQFLGSGILGTKIYWRDITDTEMFTRQYTNNKGELTGKFTVGGVEKSVNKKTVNEMYGKLNSTTILELQKQKHRVQQANGKYAVLAWDKLTDEQKKSVINRQYEHNADVAKVYAWLQEGHKYYASETMYAELRKLGIVKGLYRGDKGFVE